MTLGAVIASGLAGPLARPAGRKACIWAACLLCAVSDIIMMTTTSIGALYVGRLFNGLANGLFMTFSQLYIQECSPAEYRGLLLSAFQFWTSFGTLIGTIVDNFTSPLAGKASYLIPLGIIYVIPFFIAIGLFFIPESPRWLMEKGKTEQAKQSLHWLRPNKDAVDAELFSIQEAIDEAKANSGRALFFEVGSLSDTVIRPSNDRVTHLYPDVPRNRPPPHNARCRCCQYASRFRRDVHDSLWSVSFTTPSHELVLTSS